MHESGYTVPVTLHKRVLLLFGTPLLQKYSQIGSFIPQAQRQEMHTQTRDTHRVVFVGLSSRRAPEPACLGSGAQFPPFHCSPGLGERATYLLASPGKALPFRGAFRAGRLSWSPRSWGRSLWDASQAPPLRLPAPGPAIGCRARGRGRAGAGGAGGGRPRVSACLPGLRARWPGWLGCAWVPAPAPAPAMGNSHHKRKAPSGPRARSFWRFGRSGKRPAGRGWGGGGAGGGGGGSPCRSSRHRCCPLPGLGACECGAGYSPHRPDCSHAHTGTCNTHGQAHVHVPSLQSHTALRCMDTQTPNHIHILHPHHRCRTHRSRDT